MANFSELQQSYVDKIQNPKLKALVEDSYTVFTMPEDEKLDFVIWMSVIHNDPEAEKQILSALENEADIVEKEISKKQKPISDEEFRNKEFEIISTEYKELKTSLEQLKKEARNEKEKDEKGKDEAKMAGLLDKLNNA